jgi:site-specific DNA-methyltransferase (adenine-specific)
MKRVKVKILNNVPRLRYPKIKYLPPKESKLAKVTFKNVFPAAKKVRLTDLPNTKIGEKSFIVQADNIHVLRSLPANSIDSVVTDPPYGISFLGSNWDDDVPSADFWKEVIRVLKPGGMVLSFGSTKTVHRMTSNIESAGFKILGQHLWIHGPSYPTYQRVDKLIDKKLNKIDCNSKTIQKSYTAATETAKKWEGFGTSIVNAYQPITLARKPIGEPTMAENQIKYKVGAFNIDGCRINNQKDRNRKGSLPLDIHVECICKDATYTKTNGKKQAKEILKHSNPLCPCRYLDELSNRSKKSKFNKSKTASDDQLDTVEHGISSQFHIIVNRGATHEDKNAGLENFTPNMEMKNKMDSRRRFGSMKKVNINEKNIHPTLKATNLIQDLVRLITPSGGIVIDPFFGSGSLGKACIREGNFDFIGIEREQEYYEEAVLRCKEELKSVTNNLKTIKQNKNGKHII